MADSAALRKEMVEHQIYSRGVRDERVLAAMSRVPRESFIPPFLREQAYEDRFLRINKQLTILPPYFSAFMVAALALKGPETVLLVGGGSGYTAAILAEIAQDVLVIEPDRQQAERMRSALKEAGYRNIRIRCGPSLRAWQAEAPFEAILVNGVVDTVPEELTGQLAEHGRITLPIGDATGIQELTRLTRTGPDSFRSEDLADLHSVRQIAQKLAPRPSRPARQAAVRHEEPDLPGLILRHAQVFDDVESAALNGLIERIGQRRIVLLGEASHGTSEFYRMRARITRRLIEEKGFTVLAVEADWPDARRMDAYVAGEAPPVGPESAAFARFPAWMWRNAETSSFADWLRAWNAAQVPAARARFYGLDLYSLFSSSRAIIAYLDGIDPALAAEARRRYACLSPWEGDPAAYGQAALTGAYRDCEADVTAMLAALVRNRAGLEEENDGYRFLDAVQNAALVASAERYYRIMYYGSRAAWNLRDTHMFETLLKVLEFHGPRSKAVVWAHNSHIGDARATEMSRRGERNLGEMCARGYGQDSCRVGFGTDRGTVAAASDWGGPMETKTVRPAHPRSFEHQFHRTGARGLFLPMRPGHELDVATALADPRLERAIGVIYRPESELESHYFTAELSRQFDEYVWIDETRAVEPLPTTPDARLPDTYPFGV